jgi:hypothetical protein
MTLTVSKVIHGHSLPLSGANSFPVIFAWDCPMLASQNLGNLLFHCSRGEIQASLDVVSIDHFARFGFQVNADTIGGLLHVGARSTFLNMTE